MNSDERPDDAIRGVESNRSEPNADNGDPMNEQIPADTTDRTANTQTSAVTRDAARLRSVMSDIRRERAPTAMGHAEPQESALSPATAYLDTVMPAPRPQATELRSPAPKERTANVDQSDVDDMSRATRLRSVACLVASRQGSERPLATPRSAPMPMPAAMPHSDGPAAAMGAHVRHLDIPIYEPEHDGPSYREESGGSRVKVLMVLAGTLFTGLVIGVGLYAGGADLVSGLLGSAGSVETLDRNPAAITERPIAELAVPGAFDSLAPSESAAGGTDAAALGTTENGSDAGIPPSAEQRAVNEATIAPTPTAPVAKPRVEPVAASVVTRNPKPKPAAAAVVPRTEPVGERRDVAADGDAPAADVAKRAGAVPVKSYTVQVRATPDEAEARRIAKRLRGKGAKEVAVVRSEKNGSPLYRVRFKSYGTAGDAQAAAGRVGFSDAWILKD